MIKKYQQPTVASFFTGAGGMDEGFKAAGFKVISAMDIEEWACDTLRKNKSSAKIIGPPNYSGDLKKISPREFQSIVGKEPGSIDVFIGGPPCQPFSQAASQRFTKTGAKFKRTGFEDQEKGTLLFDYISYIKFFRPKVFLIENVPGLLTIDGGKQLRAALEELRQIGYSHTDPKSIQAANYGVPQSRHRVIIWGTLLPDVKPLIGEPTHGGGLFLKEYATACEALYNIPTTATCNETRLHKEASVARYKTISFGQRERLGRVDRLDPRAISKTVIAGGSKGGGRSHLHPFISRTLSVRECARLQTFSDDYVFTGSTARQFTQVGNAVPPRLAEHIARKIGEECFGLTYEAPLKFGDYSLHPSVDSICEALLSEAKALNPEWLYDINK